MSSDASNDGLAKSLATRFCNQRVKPVCAAIAREVFHGVPPIPLAHTQSISSFVGFQLGKSDTDFIQISIDFSSTTITLRVLVCGQSQKLLSREHSYRIVDRGARENSDGDWNEELATAWIQKIGAEAADVYSNRRETVAGKRRHPL